MAKITDYNEVQQEVQTQLELAQNELTDILGQDLTIQVVTNIYMMNDVCQGFGQDFKICSDPNRDWPAEKCSVISSRDKISIVVDDEMSYYKSDGYLCEYESLSDDIGVILMVIQTVLDRINAR